MDTVGSRKLNTMRRTAASPVRWYLRWQAAGLFVVLMAAAVIWLILPEGEAGRNRVSAAKQPDTSSTLQPTIDPFLPASPVLKPRGRRSLLNAASSPEALARNFLTALNRNDKAAIQALRITKKEFCEYVWPELPSSRLPNVTCDWAWEQATLNSLSGLSEVLPAHGKKRYEAVSIRFAKGTDRYQTYKVHKEPWLTIRDGAGKQQELRLFGSLLEMDGQYKFFSFVID